MPDDNSFTVKDYDRIIDDIMDDYFSQHDINYDLQELFKSQMLGKVGEQLPGVEQIEGGL